MGASSWHGHGPVPGSLNADSNSSVFTDAYALGGRRARQRRVEGCQASRDRCYGRHGCDHLHTAPRYAEGPSAGLMRQVIYTGGRFGLFDTLIERSRDPMFDSVPGFAKKSFCAITAGGVAAAAGNPADLSLIRMQADSMLPLAQRRNYRGVLHAMADH